jgi:hypothetical protein
MAKDPGGSADGPDREEDLSQCLDLLEFATSDRSKTGIILTKLVPWIQSKGMSVSLETMKSLPFNGRWQSILLCNVINSADCYIECSTLDISVILEFLIPKYASFQTRPLLAAFHILFRELYSVNKETFLSTISRVLDVSVTRVVLKANAVSNYFTLLDFVNHVFLLASGDNEIFMKYLPDLVRWQATLLQHCLAYSKKKGMRLSAIRTTRACLRGIFQQKESILNRNTVDSVIKVLVGSKISPLAAAVSLGLVAGVCKRLPSDTTRAVIESSKSAFYDFFTKELVGSRARLPPYVMVLLRLYIR